MPTPVRRVRSHLRVRLSAMTVLVALVAAQGCAADSSEKSPETSQGTEGSTATVLAAASLTDVFDDLADTEALAGVRTTFSFGSSTTLAEQAGSGAPGDVLATADRTAMDLALENGAVSGDPVEFARNRMVLVVPADNPADIGSLADLAGTDWVRCADEVPCGRLALDLLDEPENAAALDGAEPASLEVDVRGALAKVTSGEADAAFVYATDAVAAGTSVQTLDVPGAEETLTSYWIAPLADGNQDVARSWVAAVTSAPGRAVLTEAGFDLP